MDSCKVHTSCSDCASAATITTTTFLGSAICAVCQSRRVDVASLLSLVVRGATPEETLAFRGLLPVAIDDPEELCELVDLADVLLTTSRPRRPRPLSRSSWRSPVMEVI